MERGGGGLRGGEKGGRGIVGKWQKWVAGGGKNKVNKTWVAGDVCV